MIEQVGKGLMTNEEIPKALRRLRQAVKKWKVPVVDEIGHGRGPTPVSSGRGPTTWGGDRSSPKRRTTNTEHTTGLAPVSSGRGPAFRVLISCILSLRTKDEVTAAASARLFKLADTPEKILKLSVGKIEEAIYPAGFYKTKARSLKEVCRVLIDKHGGRVPDTIEELLELKGVGRKTANLTMTAGHGKMGLCVDTHVHRICNRWDYVRTKTPDETETVLRKKLPKKYWKEINGLLVTYGQNLCKPISPHCSECPIEEFCKKRGVGKRR